MVGIITANILCLHAEQDSVPVVPPQQDIPLLTPPPTQCSTTQLSRTHRANFEAAKLWSKLEPQSDHGSAQLTSTGMPADRQHPGAAFQLSSMAPPLAAPSRSANHLHAEQWSLPVPNCKPVFVAEGQLGPGPHLRAAAKATSSAPLHPSAQYAASAYHDLDRQHPATDTQLGVAHTTTPVLREACSRRMLPTGRSTPSMHQQRQAHEPSESQLSRVSHLRPSAGEDRSAHVQPVGQFVTPVHCQRQNLEPESQLSRGLQTLWNNLGHTPLAVPSRASSSQHASPEVVDDAVLSRGASSQPVRPQTAEETGPALQPQVSASVAAALTAAASVTPVAAPGSLPAQAVAEQSTSPQAVVDQHKLHEPSQMVCGTPPGAAGEDAALRTVLEETAEAHLEPQHGATGADVSEETTSQTARQE